MSIEVQELAEQLPTQQAEVPSTPEEVLDTRSPEEIEAAFLKQAEEDARRAAENRDPADTAAMMFHLFYPQFKGMLAGLSNKELRRLVAGLIGRGHVSEPDVPTFNDERTGNAYRMGTELLSAKFMMITKLEMEALEEAHKQAQEAEVAQIVADAKIEDVSAEQVSEQTNKEGNENNE